MQVLSTSRKFMIKVKSPNTVKMSYKNISKIVGICILAIGLSACRGQLSEKPPIHPNMNMDQQPRKEAQEVNRFFEDGRASRTPVEGTVARGFNKSDKAYYEGTNPDGSFIAEIPVDVTKSFLYRGQERYDIFCTPCHGTVGDGRGIIMTGRYGYVPAPSYHDDRLREVPDGEIYSSIYNGVRSMPSYATQIPVEDRWAIVAYIRALQASQNVQENELVAYDIEISALVAEYTEEQARLEALAEARKPKEVPQATVDLGRQLVTDYACQTCHSLDGSDGIGPTWLNLFGSEIEVITEAGETITVTRDEAYIEESIVLPNAKKAVDYANAVMAAYDYLAEHEIQSLIEYIKTLSDN